MAIDNKHTISVLNDLIETLKDGQEGFRDAAQGVKDAEYKKMFGEYATQRAQMMGELQNEVIRLGENDPTKTGSVAGAIHRGWINLKSSLTGGSDSAIVNEAERGEDSAVSNYQSALEKELPGDIRAIVEKQYAVVKQTHDRVRDLKHSLANA